MTGIQSPPADFDRLSLIVDVVDPRTLLRMAWADPKTHCAFRREAGFRFDAPDASFGVLYAAFDVATAFAETVLRDKAQLAPAGVRVPLDYVEIAGRCVVAMTHGVEHRALRLIKLYDEGLAAARIDNRISSLDEYSQTQQWAKALHDHPLLGDGIIYMSRYMGARKSVVLFERCHAAIAAGPATPLLAHADFPHLVDDFRLSIDRPVAPAKS